MDIIEKLKKVLSRCIACITLFLIVTMGLNFAAENYFNALFPDIWLNEMRLDRNIDYYFDLMEKRKDFETVRGNTIIYPYDDLDLRDIIDLRRRTIFNFFSITSAIPDDWILIFIFEPGTTRAEMADIIGDRGRFGTQESIRVEKERFLPSIVNEGYTQIVFLGAGRRVVASIHSDNKNYEFDFGGFEDGHIRIRATEYVPITLFRSEETGRIVVRLITDTD